MACFEVLVSKGHKQREGEGAVVRRRRSIALVVTFVIWYAVLYIVLSASGMQAEASQEEKQGHTEATKQEQGHSGGAAPEGDRCDRTRTIVRISAGYLTNGLPGCPNKGGLLSAQLPDTGKRKISEPNYGLMMGEKGDDEVRGLGGSDELYGGDGNDVIYGGSGGDFIEGEHDDDVIHAGDGGDYFVAGGKGDDVIYGGDGNDHLEDEDGDRDKLYCGEGKDHYLADKIDYVHSSCEKGKLVGTGGPPLLLLAGAALCSALMMLRYVIRSA